MASSQTSDSVTQPPSGGLKSQSQTDSFISLPLAARAILLMGKLDGGKKKNISKKMVSIYPSIFATLQSSSSRMRSQVLLQRDSVNVCLHRVNHDLMPVLFKPATSCLPLIQQSPLRALFFLFSPLFFLF